MADTKTITIYGESFELKTPYAEGHTLNAAEAAQLNQVRCENVGNNMRKRVKELLEAGKNGEAQELVNQYDSTYEITLATVGARRTLDPVEREARSMARSAISAQLKKEGRKVKDVDPDKLEAKIAEIAAREDVIKAAKAVVKQKEAVAAATATEGQAAAA